MTRKTVQEISCRLLDLLGLIGEAPLICKCVYI
uniref:Uncharacterized protein n=1 Tax=Rhizophora mucronata TaxID=61149 RepID=A0A2P2QMU2_RHIMU